MTRPLRIEQANNWYYIRNEGRKGVSVFKNSADVELFLNILTDCSQRFDISCHSYTLLATEFHLLLHVKQTNLARFMRQLSGVYTQGYNRKYQQNGSLFKGRYQSALIEPVLYPLWLSVYIHQLFMMNQNTKSLLSHSNYQDFILERGKTTKAYSLKILSELAQYEQHTDYQQLMQKKLPSSVSHALSRKQLPAIIGSASFQKDYQELLENSSPECCGQFHMKAPLNKADIIRFTAKTCKVPKSDILHAQYGINRNSDARNMAMFLCQQHTNMTLKEIADYFKLSHYASVSNRISHFKKSLQHQVSLQKNIQEINNALQDNQVKN